MDVGSPIQIGLQGATGPQGATGVAGPPGSAVYQGDTGVTGATGTAGPRGDTGVGAKGDTGAVGAVGAVGVIGATGAPGATGVAGAAGSQGDTGVQGPLGNTGVGQPGATGVSGATGATGLVGDTGPRGYKGDTGTIGNTGTKGDTGLPKDLYAAMDAQALIASSTITVTDGTPLTPISSTGIITLTATPAIAAGRHAQVAVIQNVGNYAITFQNLSVIASNLQLSAGSVTLNAGGIMELVYSATLSAWCQTLLLNPLAFTPSISAFTVDGSATQTREVAGSGNEAAPAFALTYVGVPSACSVELDTVESGYPYALIAPFLSGTGPVYPKKIAVLAVRTFTATATISGQGGKQRTATITYNNRRWCGPHTQATALSSAQVLTLDDDADGKSDLVNAKTGSFAVNITSGEYLWFCYRAALGVGLYLAINSERAGLSRIGTGTVVVTNDSGFSEAFEQWRSTMQAVGNVTATLSTSEGTNRRYMGPHTDVDAITSPHILALDDDADGESSLSNSYAGTFHVVAGVAEYVWYCFPARITGTPVFWVNGFAGGFAEKSQVSHTNDYGYTENYRTFRSENSNLGSIEVVVT